MWPTVDPFLRNLFGLIFSDKMKEFTVNGDLSVLDNLIKEATAALGRTFVLYIGNLNGEGESWCSDCNLALPILMRNAKSILKDEDVFITCGVGEKAEWKENTQNVFRTSKGLVAVPTLVEVGTDRILIEGDCGDRHLVPLMFKGDEHESIRK